MSRRHPTRKSDRQLFVAGISTRKSDRQVSVALAVCLSPRHRQPFSLWRFDQLSTPLAFLRRFVITDSFKIMNSQIENNLSYLGTSFSILMAFLFMNSQIDIYDSHMGSEQRQIHWISGAALFAAQKNSRNNIKIYDVGTPKTDIVKRLQCTSHMLIFFCRMGIHECACSEEKANNPNPSPFVLDMGIHEFYNKTTHSDDCTLNTKMTK